VRFPDGTKEFRYPETPPEEGSPVWHEGERYRVVSVSMDGAQASMIVQADSSSSDLLRSEEGAIQLEPVLRLLTNS
jgi:hypothetical protein